MKENFITCLEETLKWEGGYTNHPLDPGGPTNLGIIQERYDQYNKDLGLPHKSVTQITKAEAVDIYKRYYWDAVDGDNLPSGLDMAVFDFGVNSGPSRALRLLEKTRNIDTYMNEREKFLRSLRTFPTFGKGWIRRTTGIRKRALSMANDPSLTEVKKLLVKNSTKLSVFQNIRRSFLFLGTTIGGIFSLDSFNLITGLATQLKTFMADHSVAIVLTLMGVTWLALKWGEWKHLLDFKEGRYVPSGMIQATATEDSNAITQPVT